MIGNMIDIICSDESMKNKLVFGNQKLISNGNIFEKGANFPNQRATNVIKSIGGLSHKHKIPQEVSK